MRHLNRILLLVVCIIATFNLYSFADNKTGSTKKEYVILHPKTDMKRPNAPSRVFIECRYDEETMMFIMPEGIEYAEISISQNDEVIMTDVITRDMHILPSPSHPAGEYFVSCTSSDGRVFQGYLYF